MLPALPSSYFSPSNWCISSHPGGDCLATQPMLLHTEQVPCQGDSIYFKNMNEILVNLSTAVDINVAEFSIEKQVIVNEKKWVCALLSIL